MKYRIVKTERLHPVFPAFKDEIICEVNTKEEAEELVKFYYSDDDNVWNEYRYTEINDKTTSSRKKGN